MERRNKKEKMSLPHRCLMNERGQGGVQEYVIFVSDHQLEEHIPVLEGRRKEVRSS